MKVSRMAGTIEPSLSRHLFNLAKTYDDVIDLTLGDPDIQPNERIKKAANEAINLGKTRYSANAGLLELRKKICEVFEEEYHQKRKPEVECIVTVGGMEALFLTFATLIDVGDEVIMPGPYYINYYQMVEMLGGKPVIIDTLEENNFEFSAEQIESAVTDKTVAIVLNSPSNPSGQVIGKATLAKIAEIAKKNDLLVVSDEVYKTLIYGGKKHESILTIEGMTERCVLIDSISKRFSMTGYRLGYAIGPSEIIACMTKMQENVCGCAPLPSQYAAIEAYETVKNDTAILETFTKRKDYIVEAINRIPGLHCNIPAGTFYLLVNVSSTGMKSLDFAYALLEEEHVAVVPAITYGKAYDDYIRIAYTLDISKLEEAVERLENFMRKH